jgi:hypothetical protein
MDVNIWAVLVAAVASMVVGTIWYGPLFGKIYINAMGWGNNTPEQSQAKMKEMRLSYLWQFIASIVMFYVFASIMAWLNHDGVKHGIVDALWVWVGFIVPLKFGDVLWGGKKTLFWLGIGGNLITLIVGGIIIGAWR